MHPKFAWLTVSRQNPGPAPGSILVCGRYHASTGAIELRYWGYRLIHSHRNLHNSRWVTVYLDDPWGIWQQSFARWTARVTGTAVHRQRQKLDYGSGNHPQTLTFPIQGSPWSKTNRRTRAS